MYIYIYIAIQKPKSQYNVEQCAEESDVIQVGLVLHNFFLNDIQSGNVEFHEGFDESSGCSAPLVFRQSLLHERHVVDGIFAS